MRNIHSHISFQSNEPWKTPIVTERLRLVPFHTENVADVYGKFVRANVDRFVNYHIPTDLEDERNFLESQIQNEFHKKMLCRFVYDIATDEFLGTIGLNFQEEGKNPEIGLWIAPEFQGK